MLCSPSADRHGWLEALAGACLLFVAAVAQAEAISVHSAELVPVADGYALNADFSVSLNPVVIEALNKGVTIHFVVDFELSRPRKYWFNKRLATAEHSVRLSYVPLTRQYEVSNGQGTYMAESLGAALQRVGHVRGVRVLNGAILRKGSEYEAATRMRLDSTQLPPPFQVSSLTTRDWVIESDWYRWRLKP